MQIQQSRDIFMFINRFLALFQLGRKKNISLQIFQTVILLKELYGIKLLSP